MGTVEEERAGFVHVKFAVYVDQPDFQRSPSQALVDPHFVQPQGPVRVDVAHRLHIAENRFGKRIPIVVEQRHGGGRTSQSKALLGIIGQHEIEIVEVSRFPFESAAGIVPNVARVARLESESFWRRFDGHRLRVGGMA